jgi:ribosomal protein L7/L12
MSISIPVDKLLSVLSDEDLEILSSAIYTEESRRIQAKIRKGQCEPLTDEEKSMCDTTTKIQVIRAYRERVGCSLKEAKYVIEYWARDDCRFGEK